MKAIIYVPENGEIASDGVRRLLSSVIAASRARLPSGPAGLMMTHGLFHRRPKGNGSAHLGSVI